MKIAIAGAGISGLGMAYILHQNGHDITVYDPNDYAGGHSRTMDVSVAEGVVSVDTGFIVYNERNYPHLTALFKRLDVPVTKSRMSFGASIGQGAMEYSSQGLFAQKANLFRPSFWRMLADIVRFNKTALARLEKERAYITLGEFLEAMKMGAWFKDYYLLAMGAAIWSCPVSAMMDFPARTFLKFFENHGLLTIKNHPQWYSVKGGSRDYVSRLCHGFADKIRRNNAVVKVTREQDGVRVWDSQGGMQTYDKIVLACHADEALLILADASAQEREVLGAFGYQKNSVILHKDESFMPHARKAWASWIYVSDADKDQSPCVSLTYWMNNLQHLETKENIFVTLNAGRRPREDLIVNEHVFEHPVFNTAAINAQGKIPAMQGVNKTFFCGAYQRYGFHEDGLLSAVNVARAMGEKIPWE
jgi:predicted NAD/FAD-binding protein